MYHFTSFGMGHAPIQYAHQDDYYIFGLMTRGTACGIVDFKELRLNAGDVFLVQPGQVHRFVSTEDAEGWLMMADSRFVGQEEKCIFDKFCLEASSFQTDEKHKEEFGLMTTLLEHRLDDGNRRKTDAIAAHLAEAYISMIAEAAHDFDLQKTDSSPRYKEIVLAFREALSQHLPTHRQPSFYASLLNISTVYLNEIVKKVTGMNTASYIKGEVVLQAKRMLVHTNLPVKQIAYKLGFEDYSYFSRIFTQTTGVSPTDFRQKYLD